MTEQNDEPIETQADKAPKKTATSKPPTTTDSFDSKVFGDMPLSGFESEFRALFTELSSVRETTVQTKGNTEKLLNKLPDVQVFNRIEENFKTIQADLLDIKKQIQRYSVEDVKKVFNQKLKGIGTKLDALEKQMQELQKEEEKEKIPAAPKESFRIETIKINDSYKLIISHALSKDKKVIDGLSGDAIKGFISKHLPDIIDKELNGMPLEPVQTSQTEARPKKTQTSVVLENHVIKQLSVLQDETISDMSKPLIRQKAFVVETDFALPPVLRFKKTNVTEPDLYGNMVLISTKTKKMLGLKSFAHHIEGEDTSFQKRINFNPVDKGEYKLNIQYSIPSIQVSGREEFDLIFE